MKLNLSKILCVRQRLCSRIHAMSYGPYIRARVFYIATFPRLLPAPKCRMNRSLLEQAQSKRIQWSITLVCIWRGTLELHFQRRSPSVWPNIRLANHIILKAHFPSNFLQWARPIDGAWMNVIEYNDELEAWEFQIKEGTAMLLGGGVSCRACCLGLGSVASPHTNEWSSPVRHSTQNLYYPDPTLHDSQVRGKFFLWIENANDSYYYKLLKWWCSARLKYRRVTTTAARLAPGDRRRG